MTITCAIGGTVIWHVMTEVIDYVRYGLNTQQR